MTDRSVTHSTFTLERTYPVDVAQVFAAWAEPARRPSGCRRPSATHELDFRVGGNEVASGEHDGKL